MSIKVDLPDIANHVQHRGAGYLVTTGTDGRPHTTHVTFTLEPQDGRVVLLRAPAGRKTIRNIEAQPLVALLWPPTGADGDDAYNLIIDATASVVEVNDEGLGFAVLEPTHAILHRSAAG